MLYPVVMIESETAKGSGTVIFSFMRDGEADTYILTNHHVVQSSIELKEEWDPIKKAQAHKEQRKPVRVLWWDYNALSRSVGVLGKTADIVAWDKDEDLAMLRVRDRERLIEHFAFLRRPTQTIHLFDEVFAVGAGLGRPPFPTVGVLSSLDIDIEGRRFIMSSAAVIFGNSGGALYRWSSVALRYELIGVPSRMAGTFFSVVPHMAFSIPMDRVFAFIRINCLGFIVGDSKEKVSACLKARKTHKDQRSLQ